jgi:hypothetical protein
VAKGTYSGSAIDKKVSLYGGFSGNEVSREDRNPTDNSTSFSNSLSTDGITVNGFSFSGTTISVSNSVTFDNCTFGTSLAISNSVTFENCTFSSTSTITCNVNSSVIINRCRLTDGSGRAIEIMGGECTVRDTIIQGRYTSGLPGAGIYIYTNAVCNIFDSTIENCTAGNEGGGGIYSEGTCNITDSIIKSCRAEYQGAGISVTGGTCTISDSIIQDCRGNGSGGALGIGGVGTKCIITDCIIKGNKGDPAGIDGGIYSDGATLTIIRGSITDNYSSGTSGPQIHINGGGGSITGCNIAGSIININPITGTIDL